MSVFDIFPPTTDQVMAIAATLGFRNQAQVDASIAAAQTAPTGMGLLAGKKLLVWAGQATTDSSGNFTVNYAGASFTGVIQVSAVARCSGSAASNAALANVQTPTVTACSGFVTIPASTTVSILGAVVNPLIKSPAGIVVDIIVFGY